MIEEIGPHRVRVGDLQSGIGDLMHGERADLVYSDPPWGDGNHRYWMTSLRKDTGITVESPGYQAFLDSFFSAALTYGRGTVVVESTGSAGRAPWSTSLPLTGSGTWRSPRPATGPGRSTCRCGYSSSGRVPTPRTMGSSLRHLKVRMGSTRYSASSACSPVRAASSSTRAAGRGSWPGRQRELAPGSVVTRSTRSALL